MLRVTLQRSGGKHGGVIAALKDYEATRKKKL